MTEDARQLKKVQAAIEAIIAAGASEFRPGDVATYQRNAGEPMPVWELRGMFSALADENRIELDAVTGAWRLNSDSESAAAS